MSTPKNTEYLADWFVRYTKNKDLVFKKISGIEQKEDTVIIKTKDGTATTFLVDPFPEDFLKTAETIQGESKGIVAYNTKENFENLVKIWKEVAKIKNLTIYFVNPFSKIDKKWAIRPYIHDRISDVDSLEMGLNSMYIMVDPITKEEVEKLTK